MAKVENRSLSFEASDVKSEHAPKIPAVTTDPMQIVVTKAVVEKIMKEYDSSLTVIDFSAEAGSNIGDNYMAIMYAVKVNVLKPGLNKPTTYEVMLKTMPLNPARQQLMNDSKAFHKEALMYGTVFRDLQIFQKEQGIAEEKIYSDYPFCYGAFVDGKADYLAMENLKTSGYQMANRMNGLDEAHATLVMKSLGRFHALSYVKFRGNFQAILDKYPVLEDTMWNPHGAQSAQDMVELFIKQGLTNAVRTLRTSGFESDAVALEGPKFELKSVMKLMHKFNGPCKHAVISHSDCWTNNMLFKYDSGTKQPTGIKLIDFQLSHPCPRSLDLLYFLNGCLHKDLANKHEEEFLKIYYEEFSTFAKKLGFLEPELTYEQLHGEFNECRPFGIIMSLMTIPIFYANKDDVKNMEDISPEFSEESVKEFFGCVVNKNAAERISNMLNAQLHKVNM